MILSREGVVMIRYALLGLSAGAALLAFSPSRQAVAPADGTALVRDGKVSLAILDHIRENVPKRLRVAKWVGSFVPGARPATLIGGDIFAEDPDRLHISVSDPSKAGQESVTVTVETDSPGTDYDDPPTTITLLREVDVPGWFRTHFDKSLVLLSNAADNAFAVDGVANNAPGDRTHLVSLGGTVKVRYGKLVATCPVEVGKKVAVHAVVLTDAVGDSLGGEPYVDRNANGRRDEGEPFRDINGNGVHDAKLDRAGFRQRFKEELRILNETYAQVGIRFEGTIDFRAAPDGCRDGVVMLSRPSPTGEKFLTPTERALVTAGYNSAARDDIEVYYVRGLNNPPSGRFERALSFTPDFYRDMTTRDIYDSIFLGDQADLYTLSHEIYHVLTQRSAGDHRHLSERANLMVPGSTRIVRFRDASHLDTKRFDLRQEAAIWKSKYAKTP